MREECTMNAAVEREGERCGSVRDERVPGHASRLLSQQHAGAGARTDSVGAFGSSDREGPSSNVSSAPTPARLDIPILYASHNSQSFTPMFSPARSAPLRSASSALRRTLATAAHPSLASSVYLDPARAQDPSVTTTPNAIPPELRHEIETALRVDQAGELAANWIYKGQHDVLGRDPVTGPLIQASTTVLFLVAHALTLLCRRCGTKRKSTSPS